MKFPAFALLTLGAAVFGLNTARAELAYATSVTGLYSFDTANPGASTFIGSFGGLVEGQSIVGIDFRPATGELFALGYNGTTEFAQVYTINLATAGVTAVGSGFTLAGVGTSQTFGFDFNPTVDRIRIVTSNGLNFRANPITGGLAATDTTLAYATGDANAGVTPQIVGAAYSNNFAGTATTTLYAYDYGNDTIVTIGGINGSPSPNLGQLSTVTLVNRVANTRMIGFDISSSSNTAFLLGDFLTPARASTDGFTGGNLFSVDLATGIMTQLGTGLSFTPTGFSVALTPVPEPSTVALGLAGLAGLAVLRRRRK